MNGLTLIELVVSITIISIAVTAVLGVLAAVSARSSEAMLQQQAIHIAASYLNEILQKSFTDPDGVVEAGRANFDDVNDYSRLPDSRVRDMNGTAVATLSQFSVTVRSSAVALSAAPSSQVRRIDVTVRHPAMQPVVLTGFRAQY